MQDIWGFLIQTLTASGAAVLLLVVKAVFRDKLSPRWQFGVWGVLALTLPLMFRFGVEKGRLVMFLLIFLVCGGTGAITSITSDIPDGGSYLALALPGVAVAAIVLTAISIPLSLRMYRRKRV